MKAFLKKLTNPHFLYWLSFVCFLVNLPLIFIQLRLGMVDRAMIQLFWAFMCATGALLNYLRIHVKED